MQPKLKNIRVFVYGTLRKEERNSYLLKDAVFERLLQLKGFEMYSLGSYPFILPSSSEKIIIAESYLVDEIILEKLDLLEEYFGEGHPDNRYDRIDVRDELGRSGSIYVFSPLKWPSYKTKAKLLPSGDWKKSK